MRHVSWLTLALTLTLTLTCGRDAGAHGGLPIAQQIMFEGDTLIVPTKFWGVFLGTEDGQWRWICEEAINQQQARRWAYAKSGAFHVTDFAGITSSTDRGCTWVQSTGEIQLLSTSQVVADPVEPSRAWATTDQGTSNADQGTGDPMPLNALFRTDDDGLTWVVASNDIKADEYLRGVAISPNGMRLYVTGTPRGANSSSPTVLHVSRDAGKSWSTSPIPWQQCDNAMPPNCFTPDRIVPIAVDPSDADTVYLRVESSTLMVLLAAHPDGSARELLRVPSEEKRPGIGGMEFIPEQKVALVATGQGIYRSNAGGPMEKTGNLSRGECVARNGSTLYACAWNFAPDNMAVGRAPLADATANPTFTKVFTYDQTCGPVTYCPGGTSVAMICPVIWEMYKSQLGATGEACTMHDAGVPPVPVPPDPGCSCNVGARRHSPGPWWWPLVALIAIGRRCLSRRAAP